MNELYTGCSFSLGVSQSIFNKQVQSKYKPVSFSSHFLSLFQRSDGIMSSSSVLLGLFDDYMSIPQNRLTSISKIGGTPNYFPSLFEKGLLSSSQQDQIRDWTRCGVCGKELYLIAQAYAPAPTSAIQRSTSSEPNAALPLHNRMLYLWCCNSASCGEQPKDSWRCICVQVDQEDTLAFGDDTVNKEDDEVEEDEDAYRLTPLPRASLPVAHCFPPVNVRISPEPPHRCGAPFPLPPPKVDPAAEKPIGDPSTAAELADLDKKVHLKNTAVDYYFEAFRARVAREPSQVMRYYPRPALTSSTTSSARPLFMNIHAVSSFYEASSASFEPSPEEAVMLDALECESEDKKQEVMKLGGSVKRRCHRCGGKLVAEWQLLPTALYYLKPEEHLPVSPGEKKTKEGDAKEDGTLKADAKSSAGVDFGSVTVFTCEHWCGASEKGVVVDEAFVLVEPAPAMPSSAGDEADGGTGETGGKIDLRTFMTSEKAQLPLV